MVKIIYYVLFSRTQSPIDILEEPFAKTAYFISFLLFLIGENEIRYVIKNMGLKIWYL